MTNSRNPFSHIDLRVRDLAEALPLCRALLPTLGFNEFWEGEEWTGFSAGGQFPEKPFFGLTEDARHRPNGNRIAFWVDTVAEVDRITAAIIAAGARAIEGPGYEPEDDSYYAIFFEDASGNKLEIVHRTH
jgi:catechol 2,3-dioxygenase-like lactoylglutathione lyase family enzyme